MNEPSTPKSLPLGLVAFLATQVVVLCAVGVYASYRSNSLQAQHKLPPLRETPIEVRPLYDYPLVIADDQLQRVLKKLRPRDGKEKTRIGHIDHALRFWGLPAKFDDPGYLSGEALRNLLIDNGKFHKIYGAAAKSLLIDSRPGVRIRVAEGPLSSPHVDHTLAALSEAGTTLDYPVLTSTRYTNFRAILEQSLRDFSLNQVEYEWSGLTYAMFLPPAKSFHTTEGQEVTFDRLADRIMRQDLPQGVCFGNHRLYTLAILLRIDEEQSQILTPAKREQIVEFLAGMTQRLVNSQHAEGNWDGDWATGAKSGDKPEKSSGDPMTDKILATGHALEWWAMAPAATKERLHPPRDNLVRAGQWLVKTVDNLTDEQVENYFTFLSHAGRALALWRNKFPHEVPLE